MGEISSQSTRDWELHITVFDVFPGGVPYGMSSERRHTAVDRARMRQRRRIRRRARRARRLAS